MRDIQRISAILLSAFVSLPALADWGNVYASGKIGASFQNLSSVKNTDPYFSEVISPNNTTGTVLAYGGAVGYRWDYFFLPIRMEVDYTYRNNLTFNPNVSVTDPVFLTTEDFLMKTHANNQTILGNLYLDFPLTSMFAVFIGGGGGLAYNTAHSKPYSVSLGMYGASDTTDRTEAAWMATAGLSLVPVEWFILDASYRYSSLGAVRWSTYDNIEMTSHNYAANEVFLTFRFTLPSEKKAKPQPVQYRPVPAEIEAEPAYVPPRTKAPAYKPHTKAPSYEPHPKKGAEYHEEKAPAYKKKSQGYNSDRAKPVNRGSSAT